MGFSKSISNKCPFCSFPGLGAGSLQPRVGASRRTGTAGRRGRLGDACPAKCGGLGQDLYDLAKHFLDNDAGCTELKKMRKSIAERVDCIWKKCKNGDIL